MSAALQCVLPDVTFRNFDVQERLRHEEDLERNNGVWWQERLLAVPLEANVVEQLGIKRSTDKVYDMTCCTQQRSLT